MDEEQKPALTPSGPPDPESDDPNKLTNEEIAKVLIGYKAEADEARKSGLNPRDDQWTKNLDLYWNRFDFSEKLGWQAKEVMPEVPEFVDRFAAAMKEALIVSPNGFYSVEDPADKDHDLTPAIKRMMDVWLSTCGRNQNGHLLGFPAVFEEQMKLGALMAASNVVLWKRDVPQGRVAIEAVDPRFVWLDHTYRNLYRIRRTEIDKHELSMMVNATDSAGSPLFNLDDISGLLTSVDGEDASRREALTGGGQGITSARKPIVLDEYLARVLRPDGSTLYDKALVVIANGRFVVRGPEPNPYWHDKDWLVYTPLIQVPLSVYGRSYMEDFGALAKTFNELTNLILDAVRASALNVVAMVPEALKNPEQIATGVFPGKVFYLEDGRKAQDFAQALELGHVNADVIQTWQMIKDELREAANINEIGLGQFAPKGRTSATEVDQTSRSSSAMIRSIAETIETRHLEPTLDLVWKTGLQHVQRNDPMVTAAAGDQMFQALFSQRRALISRPTTFQAHGISTMIQKAQMLKALLQLLQIVSSNPVLFQAFMQEIDMGTFIKLLFRLSDVDITQVQLSDREKMMQQAAGGIQAAAPPGAPAGQQTGPAPEMMKQAAAIMGIGKGGGP